MSLFKLLVVLSLMIGGSCFAQGQDQEGQDNFTGEVKAEFVNNYYWRGTYLYPEGVPAFQPSLTLGFNDPALSLNIWSSLPLKDRAELVDVRDEIDLTLNYDVVSKDNATISVGFVSYLYFMGEFSHAEELYISGWYNVWNGLGMYAQAYFDVDSYKGIYFSAGPSYTKDLAEKLSLDARLLFSFTKYHEQSFAVIETGFRTLLGYQLTDIFSLSGALCWNYNFEAENDQYAVIFGVAAGW